MKRVALGELCSVKGGKRLPEGESYATAKTAHPYIRVCDFVDGSVAECDLRYISEGTHAKIRRYTISSDDVYISIAGTIGLVGLVPKHLSGANLTENAAKIEIHDPSVLDKRYLSKFLATEGQAEIANRMKATSQPKLALFRIAEIPVPLPPFAEQKRIAAILDAADALRAKRRESLVQLDTLLQSTFLDMFGDPVTNPKGWGMVDLGGVLDVKGGFVFKSSDYLKDSLGAPLIRIGEVNRCDFVSRNLAQLPLAYLGKYERFVVKKGAILMSLTGTVGKDDYGNAITLEGDADKYLLNQRVAELMPSPKINSVYLHGVLANEKVKGKLTGRSRGVRQANISNGDIKQLRVPLPPLDLQRRFATIVESVKQQKARLRAHLAELDILLASLQQRAFNGDL